MRNTWISAEDILDAITWSRISETFTEDEMRIFMSYHKGVLVASECCDKLGLKHSYDFLDKTALYEEPDPNAVKFCISA